MQLAHVFQHSSHVGDISGREQGQGIPIPAEVKDLTSQPHGEVGGRQVVQKESLASALFPFTGFTSIGAALQIATGIKRSKRAPSIYPFEVTDLLEYEARKKGRNFSTENNSFRFFY